MSYSYVSRIAYSYHSIHTLIIMIQRVFNRILPCIVVPLQRATTRCSTKPNKLYPYTLQGPCEALYDCLSYYQGMNCTGYIVPIQQLYRFSIGSILNPYNSYIGLVSVLYNSNIRMLSVLQQTHTTPIRFLYRFCIVFISNLYWFCTGSIQGGPPYYPSDIFAVFQFPYRALVSLQPNSPIWLPFPINCHNMHIGPWPADFHSPHRHHPGSYPGSYPGSPYTPTPQPISPTRSSPSGDQTDRTSDFVTSGLRTLGGMPHIPRTFAEIRPRILRIMCSITYYLPLQFILQDVTGAWLPGCINF